MADITEQLNRLAETIGRKHVKTDSDTLAQYAIDQMTPQAVIFPKDAGEISEVLKFANREKLAVAPWGSGSQIKMGNPPKQLDLVVCTRRLDQMIDVDTQNLTITVQAGVKFRDIQARLATQEDRCYLPLDDLHVDAGDVICSERSNSGSFLPIDPPCSDKATIGGIIAANASGSRRLLYNLPRDVVLGVRFVTPKGDVPGSGGKTVKNVSGYDVSKLLVGSMGSLGIITEITFRLLPLPEKMQTVLLSFSAFESAAGFAKSLLRTKLIPAAVDVMNAEAIKQLDISTAIDFAADGYVAVVALEAFAPAVDRMNSEIRQLADAATIGSVTDFAESDHLKFWLALSGLAAKLEMNYSGFIRAKVNYRISAWKDIFAYTEKSLSASKIAHTIQAHAGSGICYVNLLLDRPDNGSADRAVEFMDGLLEASRKAGGNTVIQCAPTGLKNRLKIWGDTGSDFVAMQTLKANLDPNGVMNPGRFVGNL